MCVANGYSHRPFARSLRGIEECVICYDVSGFIQQIERANREQTRDHRSISHIEIFHYLQIYMRPVCALRRDFPFNDADLLLLRFGTFVCVSVSQWHRRYELCGGRSISAHCSRECTKSKSNQLKFFPNWQLASGWRTHTHTHSPLNTYSIWANVGARCLHICARFGTTRQHVSTLHDAAQRVTTDAIAQRRRQRRRT